MKDANVRVKNVYSFLYERVGVSNILSYFVVGRPGPEYGLPVAVLYENEVSKYSQQSPPDG